MKKYLLYGNSPALGGQRGWVNVYTVKTSMIKKQDKESHHCNTTVELAFAKSFKTKVEAVKYKRRYNLPCLVLEKPGVL